MIDIEKEFESFKKAQGPKAFLRISSFLNEFRQKYQNKKIQEYLKKGDTPDAAQNKSRQSWVAFLGRKLENIIQLFLKDICEELELRIIKGDILKAQLLNSELSLVRRKIIVHFGQYSLLPDADLIIYRPHDSDVQIISILSIKNSFRERYTETPFWKLKLLQDEVTRPIKVFMVTPDNDGEISFLVRGKPTKARIVMEYELDSIYLAREKFDESQKVKSLDNLLEDLKLLANRY